MNSDACVQKIEKYLDKINVGVLVVDVQNAADLSDIVMHFQVSGNSLIMASDYCKTDELPHMDTLLDVLARKEEPVMLTGLSTFLKLQGEKVLRNELENLLAMTIMGHVVVFTFQCRMYLNFHDPRLSGRICIVDGDEGNHTKLIFTSNELSLPKDIILMNGIHAIIEGTETENAATVYVNTAKAKKTFPNSLYFISDLKRAFDALTYKRLALMRNGNMRLKSSSRKAHGRSLSWRNSVIIKRSILLCLISVALMKIKNGFTL
ncbi:MAG: hypothetical protein RR415_11520 [Ruthenibacterium sp.]